MSEREREEVMDELLTRFFINSGDIESEAALQAVVTQAGYWYLDVLAKKYDTGLFAGSDIRQELLKRLNINAQFREMVRRIRHFIVGACVFNETGDKILVIKEAKGNIGLPKGKLNVGETLEEGAIREVFEETNVDITPYLNSDDKICYEIDQTCGRCCFIVRGVPEQQHLTCYRRGEVQKITWMPTDEVVKRMKENSMHPWFEPNPRTPKNAKFWKDLHAKIKEQ